MSAGRDADLMPGKKPLRRPAKKVSPKRPAKTSRPRAAPKKVKSLQDSPIDGEAAVRAYISLLPAWQKEVAQRIDELIGDNVPAVRRAVKWHAPAYGTDGNGWFAALGGFKSHLRLSFFRGAALKPAPPSGAGKDMRSLDLRQGESLDEALVAKWVAQAAKKPGLGQG